MELGIFDKVFKRPSLVEKLNAVQGYGLSAVQFHLSSAGLPDMPDEITPAKAQAIRADFASRRVEMASVSGTFNIIDPDQQADGMRRLCVLAAACPTLGTRVITLSTGTRNPASMWLHHPDNQTPEAWNDMVRAMAQIARIGEEYDVVMAFEPEVNNVANSASAARRLLDELQSPAVKIVMDGANIFNTGDLARMDDVLDEAFALLGDDIALAHGKDLDHDGDAGHLPAGQGVLDYGRYLRLIAQSGYTGPLILHGLEEQDVDGCVSFVRSKGA